jgi:hypothetical protein
LFDLAFTKVRAKICRDGNAEVEYVVLAELQPSWETEHGSSSFVPLVCATSD